AATPVVLGRPPSTLQQQAERLAHAEPALARLTFTDQAYATVSFSAQPDPVPRDTRSPSPGRAQEPPVAATSQSDSAATGGYHVQIGAYASASEAKKALVATLEQASALLAEAAPLTIPVKSGSRQLYRARFV